MRTIRGKRALVTGAAGGIGRAIVARLAREGARLALLDNDEAKLRELDVESSEPPLRLTCDLTDENQIKSAVDTLLSEWGGLDILINNAGVVYYGKSHVMSHDEWQRVMDVNLLGPVALTRLLLPNLLEQPEAHIVNVSSMYGLAVTNRCTAYHLTKFGLIGFSEALRAEYARKDLGVTVVCPGFVKTGLFASMKEGSGRVRMPPSWICTTAEKVAAQTIRAIRRNRRMVLSGWLANLAHLTRRIAPGLFDALYHVRRPKFLKKRERATRKKTSAG